MEKETLCLDVSCVVLAHEFVLHEGKRCTYPVERGTYGLVYVLSGEGEYRFLSGKRQRVEPGAVLLLSTHSAYTIETRGEFRHYTVNFLLHGEADMGDILCFSPTDTSTLEALFAEAAAAWKGKWAGHEMQTVGCVYRILSLLCAQNEGPHYARRLSPAKAYLDERYAEGVTTAALAALCRMSETHFRREWQRVFGETVMAYRDRVRLQVACAFLSDGVLSVSETAERCGFADVSYFVRFFKKKTGLTPAAYRRRRLW